MAPSHPHRVMSVLLQERESSLTKLEGKGGGVTCMRYGLREAQSTWGGQEGH